MLGVHFTMAEQFDNFGTTTVVTSFRVDLFAEIVTGSFTDMALITEGTKTDEVFFAIRKALLGVGLDKHLMAGSFGKHGRTLISEAVLELVRQDACFQVKCFLEVLDHS